MAAFLVTGGAGFIGSNLVEALLAAGEEVRVLDNLSTGRAHNLAHVRDKIRFIQGDIRDAQVVDEAVRGVDYVLHQAALASVPRSIANPADTNAVNVSGTLNLLEAARQHGVKRFVAASSSSVYGDSVQLPKVETMIPNPKSPYAVTKLTLEHYLRVYSELHGMPTVALRYFNVFGPKQDPNSQYSAVIPLFAKALLKGEAPTIYGDGEQSRDFTFISNVVDVNLAACRVPLEGTHVLNVACGGRYTLNQLFDALATATKANVRPTYVAARKGDVKHSQADITRTVATLGYQISMGFEEGLQRTVEWYRTHETNEKA